MKCPACNRTLGEFRATTFKIDICKDGCSGIWFDADEFGKCDQAKEPFPKELLRVKRNADVVIDRNKNRHCPRCTTATLSRISLDKDRGLEIDQCPTCQGHWLDIGELENIRQHDQDLSTIHERYSTFEKRAQEQLKDTTRASKVRAVLELIFK
jgi:Zn-finger nucleic acid-binding protein